MLMYTLIRDNDKLYVPFSWLGEMACWNYKRENMVFTTEQFYDF